MPLGITKEHVALKRKSYQCLAPEEPWHSKRGCAPPADPFPAGEREVPRQVSMPASTASAVSYTGQSCPDSSSKDQ